MHVALSVSSIDFTSGLAEYLRGGNVVWAYLLLAATTAPPLVPNAVLLVTGGVMAAEGRLNLVLVLLVVAGSAVLGDLLLHRAGHAVSGRVLRRIQRRPRQAALLNWAALRIQRHGVPFVIGVRFLPSGRVIGGLAAGIVRYPARRYALGAGTAEVLWASYSVGAGYFSGRAASNSFYALTLGVGISVLVAGIGMLAQWISRARERRLPRGPGEFTAWPSAVVSASLARDSAVAAPLRRTAGAATAGPPVLRGVSEGGPKIGPPSAPPDEADRDEDDPAATTGAFRCGLVGRGK
ncbi:DedA family protein [Streptomyces polygonati]|uniref:DedA family protein n=1 Tax=Streptomyces polygonati TaxID=1617087 RepID=A0ABV8HWX9_9ACTN